MKKVVLFFFAVSTLAFTSCEKSSPPDIKRIKDRGTLVVAMHKENQPPMFMTGEEGDLVGFDADIARDIAEKLGVDLEYNRSATTYDEVVDVVANGDADVAISWMSSTIERAQRAGVSDPYYVIYPMLLVNSEHVPEGEKNDIEAFLQKDGIKIGIEGGTSYLGFVKEEYSRANIIQYPSDTLHDALWKGDVDAIMHDSIYMQGILMRYPQLKRISEAVISEKKPDYIVFYLNKKDRHLKEWLNIYIKILRLTNGIDALTEKYITEDHEILKPYEKALSNIEGIL